MRAVVVNCERVPCCGGADLECGVSAPPPHAALPSPHRDPTPPPHPTPLLLQARVHARGGALQHLWQERPATGSRTAGCPGQ